MLAYTRDEVDGMLQQGNAFVAEALREGMVLWERDGADGSG